MKVPKNPNSEVRNFLALFYYASLLRLLTDLLTSLLDKRVKAIERFFLGLI
jgi:hypothetical protein